MKSLCKPSDSARRQTIAAWKSVSSYEYRKDAVSIARAFDRLSDPPKDWDVDLRDGRYCVVVPAIEFAHAHFLVWGRED